jgi:hypothetical protein
MLLALTTNTRFVTYSCRKINNFIFKALHGSVHVIDDKQPILLGPLVTLVKSFNYRWIL